MGFPGAAVVRNPSAKAGDTDSIPGSGRSSEGNGNPLQYSCLEIPWTEQSGRLQSMGHKDSDATQQLSSVQYSIVDLQSCVSFW